MMAIISVSRFLSSWFCRSRSACRAAASSSITSKRTRCSIHPLHRSWRCRGFRPASPAADPADAPDIARRARGDLLSSLRNEAPVTRARDERKVLAPAVEASKSLLEESRGSEFTESSLSSSSAPPVPRSSWRRRSVTFLVFFQTHISRMVSAAMMVRIACTMKMPPMLKSESCRVSRCASCSSCSSLHANPRGSVAALTATKSSKYLSMRPSAAISLMCN
mmetsp:Transcript_53094/g.124291  ORF Transcript_53094/g.124291 Transcript_53094/m.124291 type:complete len:221 (+) Transcript_53094:75-737(+)